MEEKKRSEVVDKEGKKKKPSSQGLGDPGETKKKRNTKTKQPNNARIASQRKPKRTHKEHNGVRENKRGQHNAIS